MGSDNPDVLDFAGDYNLKGIILQSHNGDGYDRARKQRVEGGVNIMPIVQELNIYESIDKSSVTGTLVVLDAGNLIGNLPIQGTERVMFKLSTPGTSGTNAIIDASEISGHPFYVYKISNRRQLSQGTLLYTIHFGSREFMRNLRIKVSKAYDGPIHGSVNAILGDKSGLDTRKTVYYESTKNSDKVVIPNLSPFDAIAMLAKRALPRDGNGAGYYFYETARSGFYFRSWGDMCTETHSFPRKPVQKFHYSPQNITDEKLNENENMEKLDTKDKLLHDLQSVEEYKLLNNFHDTAAQTALGTYGHRVITHNLYNKSYNHYNFNYHREFNQVVHTDRTIGETSDNKQPVVSTPVDFDELGVSDYSESRVSLVPTTQFSHGDDTGNYGVNVNQDGRLDAYRISGRNAIEAGTTIQLTVKGQTYLQPGDPILFDLRPVEERGQTADEELLDKQYSGRYIVRSIRHRITKTDYKMVLIGSKDSVKTPFGRRTNKFPGEASKEHPDYIQTNKRDGRPGS
tara:strand:- start:67 stop:1608 length:1542 start_codon:yes stop_codon:yes gene_type:complete